METYHGHLILPDRILPGAVIQCKNGRIAGILEGNGQSEEGESLPYILPGLVDIHNHGALNHDYMEATDEAFDAIATYLTEHGITAAQCTTVSAPQRQIEELLSFYRKRQTRQKDADRACRFYGIHIEGPYISQQNRGAHQAAYLRTPEDGYQWILDNADIIGEITMAPELPGIGQMIADLKSAGIVVAGGHDDADPLHIEEAIRRGMTHGTHLYCAMSTLHKSGSRRFCGLCEYALIDERMTTEIIADTHHIPSMLAKMVYQYKGAEKLCLVSDAISPSGMPERNGLYSLGSGEDSTKVYVEDNVAIVEGQERYGGSVQALDQMIRNVVQQSDVPLVDAVRMASLTPAEVVGIDGECGSLTTGKRADLCFMDQKLNVIKTMIGGRVAYQR